MLIAIPENCLGCGGCVPLCSVEALLLLKDGITFDRDLCYDCAECSDFCPVGALQFDAA